MPGPIDGVVVIHNAFRADIAAIDEAALASARGKPGLEAMVERFMFFDEVLAWHAQGEEAALFPVIEHVAPLVAEAYEKDHRGLDVAFEALRNAVSVHDALETARATAAFKFHLEMHLAKEETHLFRIFEERISLPDQAAAIAVMAREVPHTRIAEFIAWLFPLIDDDDRETMTRAWQHALPAEAFGDTMLFVHGVIGDGWAELHRRIPELTP